MSSSVLTVRDGAITDGSGRRVILRGYNIGGWMNMENFLTGYPGTESQHPRALLSALRPARYELFFDRFMSAFFAEDDARYLASLGLNSVRIPFSYRHFEDDHRPFQLKRRSGDDSVNGATVTREPCRSQQFAGPACDLAGHWQHGDPGQHAVRRRITRAAPEDLGQGDGADHNPALPR